MSRFEVDHASGSVVVVIPEMPDPSAYTRGHVLRVLASPPELHGITIECWFVADGNTWRAIPKPTPAGG